MRRNGEWVEKVGSGADESCTNNRMELTALLEGLRALRRPSHVTVFTDSEYVAKPFTVGYIRKWQSRGYSKIKNPDLWKAIVRAAAMHRLEFRWVRGHSGVEMNERCDKVAGEERMKLIAALAEERQRRHGADGADRGDSARSAGLAAP